MPEEGIALVEGHEYFLTPGHGGQHRRASSRSTTTSCSPTSHEGDLLTFGDGAVQVQSLGRTGDRIGIRVIHGGHLTGPSRPPHPVRPAATHHARPPRTSASPTPSSRSASTWSPCRSCARPTTCAASASSRNPRGPLVVAKIETRAAVENLDAIVEASGAVMVARGDLGAEFPIEELPHLQKEIIRRCIAVGRPVITATQMLESMIHAPSPTRAEASDVANAVFDGSSAVMLSGETAIGNDPVHVVDVMARIAERADEEFDYGGWPPVALARCTCTPTDDVETNITNAMTSAAQRARQRDRRVGDHLPVAQPASPCARSPASGRGPRSSASRPTPAP